MRTDAKKRQRRALQRQLNRSTIAEAPQWVATYCFINNLSVEEVSVVVRILDKKVWASSSWMIIIEIVNWNGLARGLCVIYKKRSMTLRKLARSGLQNTAILLERTAVSIRTRCWIIRLRFRRLLRTVSSVIDNDAIDKGHLFSADEKRRLESFVLACGNGSHHRCEDACQKMEQFLSQLLLTRMRVCSRSWFTIAGRESPIGHVGGSGQRDGCLSELTRHIRPGSGEVSADLGQ